MQTPIGPFGKKIRDLRRLSQIANIFARHGLWSLLQTIGIGKILTPEQVKEAEAVARSEGGEPEIKEGEIAGLPNRLRLVLEELGPAFVKLGQILAAREDLLPPNYTAELRKLHKEVSVIPYAEIKKILEKELGDRLTEFESIEETPLAAGSIAQVHAAKLRTGESVVLKVQRPGIEALINADLSLMELLASLFEKYSPETSLIRPRATVDELTRALIGELDFIREGGNTAKIAENFAHDERIVIPKVFWLFSTSHVLTLEKLEGIPVWDRENMESHGLDPKSLVENGLEMFLQMVFVDGEYHGDLHPGNLLALDKNSIGVLDFGVTARISKSSREHLAALLVALVNQDFEMVSRHFIELSEPEADFNFDEFQRDVHNAVAPFLGLKLKQVRSGRMLWDLAKIAARHRAPMPSELIIFLKTLASFEGIGIHLDPDFDVIASCEKFTTKIVQHMYSPEALRKQSLMIARDLSSLARYAPYQIKRILKDAGEGHFSLNFASDDVSRVAGSINQASSRMAVSIIIASLIVGSSILVFARVGDEYYNIPLFGLVGFSIAGFLGLYIIVSILRGK